MAARQWYVEKSFDGSKAVVCRENLLHWCQAWIKGLVEVVMVQRFVWSLGRWKKREYVWELWALWLIVVLGYSGS